MQQGADKQEAFASHSEQGRGVPAASFHQRAAGTGTPAWAQQALCSREAARLAGAFLLRVISSFLQKL